MTPQSALFASGQALRPKVAPRYTELQMSIEPLSPPRDEAAAAGARHRVAQALPFGFSPRALTASERKLEQDLAVHYPQADLSKVREACLFAVEAPASKKRDSGEPFFRNRFCVDGELV